MPIQDNFDRNGSPDWNALDLRVGLEIHRQLSGTKLFCSCAGKRSDLDSASFYRNLGMTRSEMGEEDKAARHEMRRSKGKRYLMNDSCCLVEMDEEPPHLPSDELVDSALMIAELFRCDIVDYIQFMRKIVIDGSNTSGFQRTGLIGMDGILDIAGFGTVGITSICLEEDSARIVEAKGNEREYRLDRLGTAEVEITTDPSINDPDLCVDTALRIGEILRSTGKVRRGIGTIRQDVNVSIKGGSRVELKLVQDINSIPNLIRSEVIRQLLLLEVRDILSYRRVDEKDIEPEYKDVTHLFSDTNSNILRRSLDKGDPILCLVLPGFRGLMGNRIDHLKKSNVETGEIIKDLDERRRLGPEFAQYVRASTGIKGLFHSDELPSYGISEEEMAGLVVHIGIDPERDGFVVITGPEDKAVKALDSIVERARMSLKGVPEEVRRPLPDGSSEFMRPMPGSARMYPETDIPMTRITGERLDHIFNELPEDPVQFRKRMSIETSLSANTIDQMYHLDLIDLFSGLVKMDCDPRITSSILLHDFRKAKDSGFDPLSLSVTSLSRIIDGISDERYSKEMTERILISALSNLEEGNEETDSVNMAITSHSSKDDVRKELDSFIAGLIKEKFDLIRERGASSLGPLMGIVMAKFRGKIDGKVISETLKEYIEDNIGD